MPLFFSHPLSLESSPCSLFLTEFWYLIPGSPSWWEETNCPQSTRKRLVSFIAFVFWLFFRKNKMSNKKQERPFGIARVLVTSPPPSLLPHQLRYFTFGARLKWPFPLSLPVAAWDSPRFNTKVSWGNSQDLFPMQSPSVFKLWLSGSWSAPFVGHNSNFF